tara:strand:+ start:2921 stop:3259 length:339 start_codon:yes stop_codon:yes gene_type:complete
MLILTRRVGEALVIGEGLKVELIEIKANSVRLAIHDNKGACKPIFVNRDVSQTLILVDDVVIHILEINGRQVRMGTNAPKSISIHREEIYKKIQAEKKQPFTLSKRGLEMLG